MNTKSSKGDLCFWRGTRDRQRENDVVLNFQGEIGEVLPALIGQWTSHHGAVILGTTNNQWRLSVI